MDINYVFVLKLRSLEVGTLLKNDCNDWEFKYTNEFKYQNKYEPLIEFSDLNKVYRSKQLWPFFKIRIPGLKQPRIQEILENENIDSKNEALLLKRFGYKCISNPYTLETI